MTTGLDIDHTDPKEQRKFGVLVGVAFAVLGGVRSWLAGEARVWFFVVAWAFFILGFALPRMLGPVLRVWIKVAEALNWVITRLMLTLAFFLLITPTRLVIRLFGEDPLKRARRPDMPTYWEDAEEQPTEFDDYLNQF